jgi:metallo-beta-lactamase family protein
MRITFLGAAETVTGSRYVVESGSTRLLVDGGLFQGIKSLRERNRTPPPFDPASLDAIVLTHAHLDHTGYLPVLVRDGFGGRIHCTPPTAALCDILLPDSGRLQEEDAQYANRKGFSRHRPAVPLYTEEDAHAVADRFDTTPFGPTVRIGDIDVSFSAAGHILGAASVRLSAETGSVLFSGDIGRPEDLIIPAPSRPPAVDAVVMESTYGDRLHGDHDPVADLGRIVQRTAARGGVVMIPSFAVGRSQAIAYALHMLFETGAAPRVPVFLNSPMAIDVTSLYDEFASYHRLSQVEVRAAFGRVELVRTVDESKALNRRRGPLVVIAGAGMLAGGRILHHLRAFGGDHRNSIVLTGYQAPGTRGAQLLAGTKSLKIHGSYVDIRAEVFRLDGMSAHADQGELIDWLGSAEQRPRSAWLVHGEPGAADTLRTRIDDSLRIPTRAARDGETVHVVATPSMKALP